MILHIFLNGLAILVVAIIANILAQALGVTTWYGFLETMVSEGLWKAMRIQGIGSLAFLFFLYPMILGLTGYGMTHVLSHFFR